MNECENRSYLKIIAKPTAEPISFEEAINHLRISTMERSVQALISVVRQHIDGKDGWLGRALITQTWELVMDRFPTKYIRVPLPPLQEVTSITYIDANGDEQILPEEDYTVSMQEPALIYPGYGKCFPSTRCQPDAVRVKFTAGYGAGPEDVPMPIKQALLLLLGHWYENREIIITGTIIADLPMAVDALLAPHRIPPWL